MQNFNIVKTTPITQSFRVQKVVGMYDLSLENMTQHFKGSLTLPVEWNIGAIVGRSGTGKSTIAKEQFTLSELPQFSAYPLIEDMPQERSVEEITKMFTNVGLSTPTTWLKPYDVLSNGEKMRAQLCYLLLTSQKQLVFDEFTSVVDRDVAKVVSRVVAKQVRAEKKQFVAVSCHYDILEYLEPDWVFNTDTMLMTHNLEKKRKPIEIKVFRANTNIWRVFEKYHYMSSDLNNSAQCYVATAFGKVVAFIAVLHFPHPKVKNMKKVTRLVVLPDYQGIGLGKHLLNFVGEMYHKKGFRVTITTSHPALNKSLRAPWRMVRQGRVQSLGKTSRLRDMQKTLTLARMTCTWEYSL